MFLYSFIQKPSKDNFLNFLRAIIDQTFRQNVLYLIFSVLNFQLLNQILR